MKSTKTLAYGGIISALSIVLLLIAAYVEVVDISAVVVVSLGIVYMQIEFGTKAALTTFFAVSFLAGILLPSKIPALMYICFGGWYPIVKRFVERLSLVVSYIVKIVVFNAALLLYALTTLYVLMIEMPNDTLNLVLILTANLVFLVYDYVLSRLITVYIRSIRNRFKKF